MQELFWTMDFQIASGYTAKLQEKKSEGFQYNKFSPMEPRTYQYKFYSYLNKAYIKKSHFHALRHTFATNCISIELLICEL